MHAVCCARPKELQADVESDARPLLPHLLPPPRGPRVGRLLLLLFCFFPLCCQAPSGTPFLLFLGACFSCVCHIAGHYSFSSLCHLFYLSSALFLRERERGKEREKCARWEGVLQGTASGLILRCQGASGCGLCHACRHLLLLPFSSPGFCKYISFLFFSPSLIVCCSGWFEKKTCHVVKLNVMCIVFNATCLCHNFFFFFSIQWHYIVARFFIIDV